MHAREGGGALAPGKHAARARHTARSSSPQGLYAQSASNPGSPRAIRAALSWSVSLRRIRTTAGDREEGSSGPAYALMAPVTAPDASLRVTVSKSVSTGAVSRYGRERSRSGPSSPRSRNSSARSVTGVTDSSSYSSMSSSSPQMPSGRFESTVRISL